MSRALVEQAQQGDRDAYERLARGAARRLYLVAQRILRDTDQAEDAVQRQLDRHLRPVRRVTLTSLDPFTGTATLPADTDRQYESAVQLPDGRVVLIGGEEPDVVIGGRNPVDIFR